MVWTHDRLKINEWRGEPVRWKQRKFNGHRLTFFRQADGCLLGFGRTVREDLELARRQPKIDRYPWYAALRNLPAHSSVDGELYVEGGVGSDVPTAVAHCSPTLRFAPFAVPVWAGRDISMESPAAASDRLERATGLGLIAAEPVSRWDTEERLCDAAKAAGWEGYVLKATNGRGWYKVKPVRTMDVIVTGFGRAAGRCAGGVGSLIVIAYVDGLLVELANVGGLDDIEKAEIDPESDSGRVCEITYQSLGSRGRLLNARFAGWRDDKPAEQCRYAKEEL